jgi:hypothetical protein
LKRASTIFPLIAEKLRLTPFLFMAKGYQYLDRNHNSSFSISIILNTIGQTS